MEASVTSERPPWNSFWHRASIVVDVHCIPSLVLFNLSAQRLCQNHKEISSRSWFESVRIFSSNTSIEPLDRSQKKCNFCIKIWHFLFCAWWYNETWWWWGSVLSFVLRKVSLNNIKVGSEFLVFTKSHIYVFIR